MDTRTRNVLIAVAITLVGLVVVGLCVALIGTRVMGGYGPAMMGGWGRGFHGWGMMLGGGLVMLLFWLAVIGGLVWLVTSNAQRGPASAGRQEESALDVLKRRYARGEISKQEYEDMRRDLDV